MKGGVISGNAAGDGTTPSDENISPGEGGGVSMHDSASSMVMSNGEISGNTAGFGGGVYMTGGNFTMTGGSITGNKGTGIIVNPQGHAQNGGGGVKVVGGGTFTMSGKSRISGNEAIPYGGGIYGGVPSTITMMDESIITGNKVENYGGGVGLGDVYNSGTATFNMKGGIISDNTAGYGGGVYVQTKGRFYIENGIVYGKDAAAGLANILSDPGGAGVALREGNANGQGSGEWGVFDVVGMWSRNGQFDAAVENTITVVNGVKK
jgi:hypothetical protein